MLSDKLSATGEKVAKSLIFLPMAISFVGATAIWGLVYAYNNPGQAQTGLLNAIWVGLGGEPQTWLQIETAKLNSILLMVILIWLQVGFAMVLLSSAIKGVPEDTIEAARIDGASELQIFFQVIIPQVKGTIITVFVTVFILVLKVFDIVYVTTNGSYNTNVIANLFFNKLFAASQAGQATAIVVVLLIAVIPLICVPDPALQGRGGQPMSRALMKDGRPRSPFSIVIHDDPRAAVDDPHDRPARHLVPHPRRRRHVRVVDGLVQPVHVRVDDGQLHAAPGPAPTSAPGSSTASSSPCRRRDPDHVRGLRGLRLHLHGLPVQGVLLPADHRRDGGADPGGVPADAQHARAAGLGISGQYIAVWLLHTGFGMPLCIYTLRNYMSTLPASVVESAKIDGC